MIKTKEKGGMFGKTLAAACSVALVASLTPAAAVSAFAAQTQKAPETLTLTIQQLGSDGNVVKAASMKLGEDLQADYFSSASNASVVYSTGALNGDTGTFGVATITSSSAATVTGLIENIKAKDGTKELGNFAESVLGSNYAQLLPKSTVTIESGYTADAATLEKTGVIADFVQSVDMSWNDLKNSTNWYPETTATKIVTTNPGTTAAYLVTSGHTVLQNITGQTNTTGATAGTTAVANTQPDEVKQAIENDNGFTFITGITANNAYNHRFEATQKMVQGVSNITVTVPYQGLKYTERVAGTNWDDTMIDTLAAAQGDDKDLNAKLNALGIADPAVSPALAKGVFVVATAGGYEDALAASGFAGLLNAPLLMTDRNTLTASTKKYIEDAAKADNGTKTIYLIGGNVAVSDEVQAELEAIDGVANTADGAVIRIAGENSWDTALEIYKAGSKIGAGWQTGSTVTADQKEIIVATSIDFQDALSISPYAYANKLPVILTTNNAVLSDSVAEAMQADINTKTNPIKQATIVGGTVVVSPVVNNQLLNIPINRLAGTTGYDTSNDIAVFLTEKVGFNGKLASVATGELYLDALSSCNFTGTQKTVLLLANDAAENGTAGITGFLTQYGPNGTKAKNNIDFAVIFGGTAVVSDATQVLANNALIEPTYTPYSID